MILCDAGPLIALADSDDPYHARCLTAAATLPPGPMITTWVCLAEAMYLLGEAGGHRAQERLWDLLDAGKILIHTTSDAERQRMRALMRQYRDTPMDLADASLVAAAESLDTVRVFTVDRDFRVYRAHGNRPFEIVP